MRSFSLGWKLESYDAMVKLNLLPASPEIFSHVTGFSEISQETDH